MTDENAIKYLKQLYPNGGHCWLDEQRIDAISIAINAIEFKEKVRAEIERLRKNFKVTSVASPSKDTTLENIAKAALCRQILSFIDSMQEEEIPPKFPIISSKEELKQKPFKVEKGKWYVCIKDYRDKNCTFTKGKKYKSDKDGFLVDDEDKDTFERKIWEEDACEYFRPIKCMYTEYNYTDEDRKVLCDGCEEECEYSKKEEPVSEDLEEEALVYIITEDGKLVIDSEKVNAFKAGAKWQITKLMKDATEVIVHIEAGNYPYIPQMELYDYDKDVPLAKEGDKYKVVLIKED